jgi:Tol biopolymer transport system component
LVVFGGKNPGSIVVWDAQTATTVYSNSLSSDPASAMATSADGNHIIYGNGFSVFVINRPTGTSQPLGALVPTSHPGFRFTADGRYVVYSRANNSISQLNGTNQVYLYDFQTGASLLISQNPSAAPGNGTSDSPDISSDGRFIVYRSFATDIAPLAAMNGMPNLFLYDRAANSNALLTSSFYRTGTADNRSRLPLFSDDGRTLVFESAASDLSPGDFNSSADVFALSLLYANISLTLQGPTITWPTQPGETYHVQFKNSLSDANWQEVSGVITFAGEQAQLTDLAPPIGQRFYRIATN